MKSVLAGNSKGRADLIRAWSELGQPGLKAMARCLGFREDEEEPAQPRREHDDRPTDPLATDRPASSALPATPHTEPLRRIPFWYVEEMEVPDQAAPNDESPKAAVPIDAKGLGRRAGKAPESPPLVADARLLPALRRRFLSDIESREVDVVRLAELWSRGRQVRRLPFRPLAAWAPTIRLVVDRSIRLRAFWDDQDRLARRLRRLLGDVSIHEIDFFENDPLPWRDARGRSRELIVEPEARVLVLGDLGFLASGQRRAFWRRVGLRLRRQAAHCTALLPCPPERWDRKVLEHWGAIEWERPFGRRVSVRALVSREDRAERLLTLLSFSSRIEPGLLRAVRRLLPASETDAGTEVDALNHPEISGFSALAVGSELRLRLQPLFADLDPDLKMRVVAAMRAWRAGLPEEIWLDEALGLSAAGALPEEALTGEEIEAAKQMWRRVARTATSAEERSRVVERVQAFVQRSLGNRQPPAVWRDPEIRQDLWKAWSKSWRGEGLPPLPSGLGPELFGAEGDIRGWRAWQIGGEIRFIPIEREPEYGIPLFEFEAGQAVVSIDGEGIRFARSVVLSEDASIELPESPGLILSFDRARVRLRRVRQPEWASAIWRDRSGIWAIQGREGGEDRFKFSPQRDSERGIMLAPEAVEHWEREIERPSWANGMGRDRYGVFVVFAVDGIEQKMRWIEPGSFMMGSPADEPGRYDREGPQHLVTLNQGFWLGETPCTQALWMAVMGTNPSQFQSSDRPVEQVSWEDCQEFFARLEERIPGFGGRFPTEAEWEYACRAGTEAATYAGPIEILGKNNALILDAISWYGGNSGVDFELESGVDSSDWEEKQYEHVLAGTHPVKRKEPNPWGLYDMLGNVDEWCVDWYGDYPEESVNPTGPVMGSFRVLRGGSWGGIAQHVRAACRWDVPPSYRWSRLGFRLARGQSLPGQGAEPQGERSEQARSASAADQRSGEGRAGGADPPRSAGGRPR